MYRGENQEQYISPFDQKQILICLVGEYSPLWGSTPPSVLKGFSLGIHALKKRGMACFWCIKIWKKISVFYGKECIGERMYRGENV